MNKKRLLVRGEERVEVVLLAGEDEELEHLDGELCEDFFYEQGLEVGALGQFNERVEHDRCQLSRLAVVGALVPESRVNLIEDVVEDHVIALKSTPLDRVQDGVQLLNSA